MLLRTIAIMNVYLEAVLRPPRWYFIVHDRRYALRGFLIYSTIISLIKYSYLYNENVFILIEHGIIAELPFYRIWRIVVAAAS